MFVAAAFGRPAVRPLKNMMRDFEASLAGVPGLDGEAPLVAAVAAKAMAGAFGNVGGLLSGGRQMAPAPFRQPHAEPQGVTGLLGRLGGLLHAFEEGGLGSAMRSWVGPGPNDPVSVEQVRPAVGADLIRRVAEKTGPPEPDVAPRLAREAVSRPTPHGRLPSPEETSALPHGCVPWKAREHRCRTASTAVPPGFGELGFRNSRPSRYSSLASSAINVAPKLAGSKTAVELQELRYFLEIASTGSLSRTAGRLSISQPTLSRHLGVLEREMRTGLFYRHGRGVQLTEAGRRLFDVATAALRQLEGVKEELQAGGLDEVGEVTVGTPPSIASTVGADLAVAFATQYPRASLRMREGFSGVLLEWIEAGRLDCAVLYEARRSNNVLCTPLFLEQLFLVEDARGATGRPETADISELATLPCLLTGPGNGLRRVFDAACWSERVQPHVAMEIDCVAALKLLVERGVGCTVLPFGAVHREVEENRLRARPFRSPAMRAMLVVATPPHKPVTPMTRATIRLLEAQVERLAASGVLRGDTRDLSQRTRFPSGPPADFKALGAGPAA